MRVVEGAVALMSLASLCNFIALMAPWEAHCISSAEHNKRIDSDVV